MIDLHNHLLPGVDDGAVDIAESRAALERMYDQGVRALAVTPHVRASSLFKTTARKRIVALLEGAWNSLVDLGKSDFPDLRLFLGTELMLDHPNPDLAPEWVRLAGTRYVLVEFPGMLIPPRAVDALSTIVEHGYTPVVAHPERYRNATADCDQAQSWREVGARLQVNCGSLLGFYGGDATRRAWSLIEAGSVDYLASDYHARGRLPIEECRRLLDEEGAGAQSELLLRTNPARLLEGLDPLEVPPTGQRTPRWKRLVRKGLFWGH